MPKDNRNNKQYSKEFKESIIKRLESSPDETVYKISQELGIAKSTIYQWAKNRNIGTVINKSSTKWNSQDKFHIVLETYSLSEEELSAYCRRKGIYVDDIKNWREQCLNANSTILKDPQKLSEELKEEKQKIKDLEKEL